jgi:hypothetical protein
MKGENMAGLEFLLAMVAVNLIISVLILMT